ncbi:hypothetical protein niasHT_019579 [Heterodera trifolii]|uniref:DUF304 domain-containing protein n=1 Tax=Heterodera trifolii TaxID=157864 RepID=A0ABD2L8A3_9BILA
MHFCARQLLIPNVSAIPLANAFRSVHRISFCHPSLFGKTPNRPTHFLSSMPKSSDSKNVRLVEESAQSMEWTADELALKEKATAENAWTPIYRYRGFVGVWFILRFNLVFFASSLASLPLSISQHIPISPSIGLILFSSLVFAGIKKYFTRIVAVISVDTASRSIYRIGYPSVFATRRSRFARFLDVQPLSTNSDSVRGVARLRFTDGAKDDFLLLPTVFVEIRDKKAAFVLFGSAMKHFDKDIVPTSDGARRRRKSEQKLRLETDEQIMRLETERRTKRRHQIGKGGEETRKIGHR